MKVDEQFRITIPNYVRQHVDLEGEANIYLLGDWENNPYKVRVLISPKDYNDVGYCWIARQTVEPQKGRVNIRCFFNFLFSNPKPEDFDVQVYMEQCELYLLCKRKFSESATNEKG